MIKSILTAVLAAVLIIGVTGCGDSAETSPAAENAVELTDDDWGTLSFDQLLVRILSLKSIPQLETELQTGTPEAMTSLAIALTVFGDEEASEFAQDLYASACEDSFHRACIELAVSQYLNAEASVLAPKAAQMLATACDEGASIGCYFDLLIKMDLLTASDDLQEFAASYSGLCDTGIAEACYTFGAMSEEGYGIKTSHGDAINAYIKGCLGNDGSSCTNLGIFYLRGVRVPQDSDKAKELFDKACGLADARGCTNYASLVGPEKAAKIYKEQCDQGDGLACANLGRMTYYGRGVERHLSNGRSLIEQGCALGEAYACKILKEIT